MGEYAIKTTEMLETECFFATHREFSTSLIHDNTQLHHIKGEAVYLLESKIKVIGYYKCYETD